MPATFRLGFFLSPLGQGFYHNQADGIAGIFVGQRCGGGTRRRECAPRRLTCLPGAASALRGPFRRLLRGCRLRIHSPRNREMSLHSRCPRPCGSGGNVSSIHLATYGRSLTPDCLSIFRNTAGSMSLRGCCTVVVPGFTGCFIWWCEPFDAINIPPIFAKPRHHRPAVHAGIIHIGICAPALRHPPALGILAVP